MRGKRLKVFVALQHLWNTAKQSSSSKLADDSKLSGSADTIERRDTVQRDLDVGPQHSTEWPTKK